MRAVAIDKEAALLMGVNIDRIISATFALGSALAAAAGILVGMYYNRIDPYMGMMPGLKAFVAAVLGGIGIVPGAVVGGLFDGRGRKLGGHHRLFHPEGCSGLRCAHCSAALPPQWTLGEKGH